ncbi:MAG: HD domain-containing protein [Planctomycetes bacterium]|nr:HD domain-containing protein [Planctomycetota bacterium]
MISIRTKLIFFIFLLIAIVDAFSCLLFLIHTKRQQKEVFKKLGASLVTLLAQDNEVKQALSYEQPAFLDIPIKRLKALDREKEIGYLRISNGQTVILEEKTPFLNIQMEELPHRNLFQNQDSPLYNRIITSSGEVLYDFSIPVFEKTFSEEEFAAQILSEDLAKTKQHVLGFIQIGLSTRKLNEKIYKTIYYVIIPTGFIIIFGGICITFFLRRYIVSPIRQMASVTLDIAKGDLTRTVNIRSNDEIGQLSLNFNKMTKALGESYAELTLAYDTTIEGWSRALDLRDKETEGHTLRVTEMTLKLAQTLGVKKEELTHIRRGALLHDIGKMGIPDSILLKPDELTEEEWQIMRKHPEYAYQLLSPITYLHKALDIPYCHHEKWDGSGYPRGLKGEQIPLAARIFAVTDVWDALHSDRPYRPALPKGKAIEYIQAQSGTHFDPHVVKVFLKMSW